MPALLSHCRGRSTAERGESLRSHLKRSLTTIQEPDGSVTIVAGGDAGLLAGVHPSKELWRLDLLQVRGSLTRNCHFLPTSKLSSFVSGGHYSTVSPFQCFPSTPDSLVRSPQLLGRHLHILFRSPLFFLDIFVPLHLRPRCRQRYASSRSSRWQDRVGAADAFRHSFHGGRKFPHLRRIAEFHIEFPRSNVDGFQRDSHPDR